MPTKWVATSDLAKLVALVGFDYDPDQDIIFSRTNAPQAYFGYSLLYDDVAPIAISAIIDCEPIYFDYDGKSWMIEFWKGQYGIETGAEIGVYYTESEGKGKQRIEGAGDCFPDESRPQAKRKLDARKYDFFTCAVDHPLVMSLELYCGKDLILKRGPESHWWLTGFKWGICNRPKELTVRWSIRFPNESMCKAFKWGMRKSLRFRLGPTGDNTISQVYARPHFFPQPGWRCAMEKPIMAANAELVRAYNDLKSSLGLKTNDPNGFKTEEIEGKNLGPQFNKLMAYFGKMNIRVDTLTKLWDKQGS
jgi:hypothetical protein